MLPVKRRPHDEFRIVEPWLPTECFSDEFIVGHKDRRVAGPPRSNADRKIDLRNPFHGFNDFSNRGAVAIAAIQYHVFPVGAEMLEGLEITVNQIGRESTEIVERLLNPPHDDKNFDILDNKKEEPAGALLATIHNRLSRIDESLTVSRIRLTRILTELQTDD